MTAQPNQPVGTVEDAVHRFLLRLQARNLSPDTVTWYRRYLKTLVGRFGPTPVADLDPDAVDAVAFGTASWGPDTQRNYLASVEALLKFAGRPVTFEKPPRGSSGAKAVIPESTYLMAIGAARKDLRPLLAVLWNTGARPKEIRLLTVAQVDWSAGVALLDQHKTVRRTGKPRLLVFPPPAMAVLQAQRERYQAGLLFRTQRGTAYTCPGLAQAVWRLADRIGTPLFVYGMRHTWATRALELGIADSHVAAAMGHTSTAMVHKHYSHINQNARLLREVMTRVSGATDAAPYSAAAGR